LGDVVMFGARDRCSAKSSRVVHDYAGLPHEVAISCGRPLFPLGVRGILADNRAPRAATLRKLIGWEWTADSAGFIATPRPMVVSIDLDVFTTGAAKFRPWRLGHFVGGFANSSRSGWTGANFYGNWYPELLLLQLRANRSFHANRISYSLNLMSMFSQANCSSPDLLDYVLVGAGLSGWA
jgi:hypothetical protein